jgi:hypothetical protein
LAFGLHAASDSELVAPLTIGTNDQAWGHIARCTAHVVDIGTGSPHPKKINEIDAFFPAAFPVLQAGGQEGRAKVRAPGLGGRGRGEGDETALATSSHMPIHLSSLYERVVRPRVSDSLSHAVSLFVPSHPSSLPSPPSPCSPATAGGCGDRAPQCASLRKACQWPRTRALLVET